MLKALIQVLGAFLAAAPLAEDAKGRRSRQAALLMIMMAIFAGVLWAALHR